MSATLRRAGRSIPILVLVAVLVAAGVAVAVVVRGGGDHTVTVDFSDANGLVAGNEVRIAGIEAGSVRSVSIATEQGAGGSAASAHRVARTVLAIDGDHWPLNAADLFAVRPKGVLSDVYVSITPGSGPRDLDTGQVVTSDRTTTPVNLDAVSDVFTPDVRQALRTAIDQGDLALGADAQNGGFVGAQGLNDTIANLDPLTRDLAPVSAVLADRTPELHRLDGEYGTILGELSSQDAALRGLIDSSATVLGVLADKQAQLTGLLDHAASTLTTLDQTLSGEQPTLVAVADRLPAALDRITAANRLLTPLVTRVNPHIPSLMLLLEYFRTGTGFASPSGVSSLRVDASIAGHGAVSCGGQPAEQRSQGCPSQDQPSGEGITGASSGGSAGAAALSSQAATGGAGQAGSAGGQASGDAAQPLLGGLVG